MFDDFFPAPSSLPLARDQTPTYLYRVFVLPLVLCVPMVAVLFLMQRWFIPHRLSELLIQLVIAGLVYGLGLVWAFWTHRAWDVGS